MRPCCAGWMSDPAARAALDDTDPARDATVLLIGRGAGYPALSVALGERMGVVGALSARSRGETPQRPRHRRHRARRRFYRPCGRCLPHRAGRRPTLPQPAGRADVGCPGAGLRSAEPRNHLRRAGAVAANALAPDPPARLRDPSQPHAQIDRRRRPARFANRAAGTGRVQDAISPPPSPRRWRVAADCRWRALPSIRATRARNSTARGF